MNSFGQQVCMDADVQRWWPLGYGTPRLYDLEVSACVCCLMLVKPIVISSTVIDKMSALLHR
jgi:hypothetical protein